METGSQKFSHRKCISEESGQRGSSTWGTHTHILLQEPQLPASASSASVGHLQAPDLMMFPTYALLLYSSITV